MAYVGDTQVTPMFKNTNTVFTKKLIYHWGHEIGDSREYTVGRNERQVWIRGKDVDISGPVEFMSRLAEVLTEMSHEDFEAIDHSS